MTGSKSIGKTSIKAVNKQEGNSVDIRAHIRKRQSYLLIKRIFDIIVSVAVLLCILSWLFPLLFLLIRLDSKGPIFFVQRRVGYLGRSFYCLKFRTMYVNDEADSRQASEKDPRITRIGRILRVSNLDELPQFLNVLTGQMSIVGPRPHMYEDCINFSRLVDAYKFRNLMKPGITGLAQVKGFRGPAHTFEQIFRRYQWDAFYVRNAGFWLDLRIVHRTAIQTISYFFNKMVAVEDFADLALGHEWVEQKNVLN